MRRAKLKITLEKLRVQKNFSVVKKMYTQCSVITCKIDLYFQNNKVAIERII